MGSGKADELKMLIEEKSIGYVIFDNPLSPVQQRNLNRLWGVPVLDRTELILDIFAQRARSNEGKLQVELARIEHQLTRLVRGWTHLERQRGGIGQRGGPGEKQNELDRLNVRSGSTIERTDLSNRASKLLSGMGVLIGVSALLLGWLTLSAIQQRRAARRMAAVEAERSTPLEWAIADRTRELREVNERLRQDAETHPAAEAPGGLGDFGSAEMPVPAAAAAPAAPPAATPAPAVAGGGGAAPSEGGAGAPAPASDPNRKIIKDATMILEVAKVDLALSQFSSIAAQAGGYILETRSDLAQEGQKQAFVRMAVPVDAVVWCLARFADRKKPGCPAHRIVAGLRPFRWSRRL